MSIAQQEAGDDCAGQKNWGGSWCADGGPWEGLGVQMGPREGRSPAPVHSSYRGNKLLWWPQSLKIFVLIHLIKLSQQHTQPDKVPHYRAFFATSQWLPLHLFSKLITRAPYLLVSFPPSVLSTSKVLLTRRTVLSGLRLLEGIQMKSELLYKAKHDSS